MRTSRPLPLLALAALVTAPLSATATTYYVRQTVGRDSNDGKSPATAWERIAKLSYTVKAGDTAYVGPGFYRDEITVMQSGTVDAPLTLVADTTGQHTGDPPGMVMITGAEPIDEGIFARGKAPGVYEADFPAYKVFGVVELDGDQYRYRRVTTLGEYLREHMDPVDVVAKLPSSYHYDEETKRLYLHTSDGREPRAHEIELMRRLNGISAVDRHYVTVVGFTLRHMGDAGINFFTGSTHGVAIGNTSYGSRQGIRVYGATDVLAYGNTLFRNENCGIYFAKEAFGGKVIGNVLYENIKGARWSSASNYGLFVDNVAFDNLERGVSLEEVTGALLRGNRLFNNAVSQLLDLRSSFASQGNCFANGAPEQLVAESYLERYPTLADFRKASGQDLRSREVACGAPPEKVDVHRLNAAATGYLRRARKLLQKAARAAAAQAPAAAGP